MFNSYSYKNKYFSDIIEVISVTWLIFRTTLTDPVYLTCSLNEEQQLILHL